MKKIAQEVAFFMLIAACLATASLWAVLVKTPRPFKGSSTDQWATDAATVCPALCNLLDPQNKRIEWDTNYNCEAQGMFDPTGTFHERAYKCYCSCSRMSQASLFVPGEDPKTWASAAAKYCPSACKKFSKPGKEIVWDTAFECKNDQGRRNTCQCGCIDKKQFARPLFNYPLVT